MSLAELDVVEFRTILSSYNSEIGTAGRLGHTSANKLAEDVYARLLNALFGWSLENLNGPGRSEKAVDLIDDANRIVVQVTATCSAQKINGTLRSNKTKEYHQRGYRLMFAFVGSQDNAAKVQGRNGWTIHDPNRIGFDRKEDALFTANLVDQFEQLGPDMRKEILRLVHGDIGRIVSPTLTHTNIGPDVIKRINERLIRQRENHPSFQLMRDSFDDELLPQGKRQNDNEFILNSNRLVKTEGSKEVSFRTFICESWKTSKQTHLFITGRGGVGKTIALLTFTTEEGFLPRGVPAIYIPLYDLAQYAESKRDCVDRYLGSVFSTEECNVINHLSHEPWNNGPSLILLLDGYNEVPADKTHDVSMGIRLWAERPGTQLVTTSRVPGLFSINGMQWLDLQPLSRNEVRGYLERRGLSIPKDGDTIWTVLETPLMLKLYTDVESLPRLAMVGYLQIEPSDSAGHLIWNYLQRELWRVIDLHRGDYSEVEYAAAILLTLPYVCWRMESMHEFSVGEGILNTYIREACNHWSERNKLVSFSRVEESLGQRLKRADEDDFFLSQLGILKSETGLFGRRDPDSFTFMHQSLRDGLAAVHLRNEAKVAVTIDSIPTEFDETLSEDVEDHLADLVEEELWIELWEVNRKRNQWNASVRQERIKKYATHNLLRLARRHGIDLSMLSFAGMDLRGMSLFGYRKAEDHRLPLSSKASDFCGTWVNTECFIEYGHGSWAECVCFSRNSRVIACGTSNGAVYMWDTRTREAFPKLDCGARVESICLSPDGKLIACGYGEGIVRIWNVRKGERLAALGCGASVSSLCFSSEGQLLACGTWGGVVHVWDANTFEKLELRDSGCGSPVGSLCFSSDDQLLACGTWNGTVHLWDVDTYERLPGPDCGDAVDSLCFSPHGHLLACGTWDGSVCLWDIRNGSKLPALGCDGPIRCISYLDSQLFACVTSSGAVHMWDAVTYDKLLGLDCESPVESACFSLDGRLLACVTSGGAVRLWDARTLQVLPELYSGWVPVGSTCFSRDSKILACGYRDGTVRLWNSCTLVERPGLDCRAPVTSVCFSPDGRLLACSTSEGWVCIWNAHTFAEMPRFDCGAPVGSICFSSEGRFLACGTSKGSVRLWDLHAFAEVPGFDCGAPVDSLSFSPQGYLLACGDSIGLVHLWDVNTHEKCFRMDCGAPVDSICIHPNGELFACVTSDGDVRLWDISTQVEQPKLECVTPVTSIGFSSDGRLLACGDSNGCVCLWDAHAFTKLHELKCEATVDSLCFSPNSGLIMCGDSSGCVRLWDTDMFEMVGDIHPLYGVNLVGLDLSLAVMDDDTRTVLLHNGVKVPLPDSVKRAEQTAMSS